MKIKVDKNETIEIGKKETIMLLLSSIVAFIVPGAWFIIVGDIWGLILSLVTSGAIFCSGILMMTLYHAIRIDKGLETTVEDKKREKVEENKMRMGWNRRMVHGENPRRLFCIFLKALETKPPQTPPKKVK